MGPDADLARVHAVVEARAGPRPATDEGFSVDVLARALAGLNLLAARKVVRVAAAQGGLDIDRMLATVNTSTGRSEATRARLAGEVDSSSLTAARSSSRHEQGSGRH